MKTLIDQVETSQGKRNVEEYFVTLISAPLEDFDQKLSFLAVGTNLGPQDHLERSLLFSFREFWDRATKEP
jgi:hypothetical protein